MNKRMAFSYLQDREMDTGLRGRAWDLCSFWPDDLTLLRLYLGFRLGEYKLSKNKCILSSKSGRVGETSVLASASPADKPVPGLILSFFPPGNLAESLKVLMPCVFQER